MALGTRMRVASEVQEYEKYISQKEHQGPKVISFRDPTNVSGRSCNNEYYVYMQ